MEHLKILAKDPKLKKLLKLEVGPLQKKNNMTMGLISSIISQQLSVKVAATIKKRFLGLFDGKSPTPEMVSRVSFEELRSVGLSHQKAKYVHNVAAFMAEHGITRAKLNKLSNEEVIELLTQIKGVGRWTVEMLLIFRMGREDVFAVDDYGIQKAMIKLYGLETLTKKDLRLRMFQISGSWAPYRSYACLYLWKSLES